MRIRTLFTDRHGGFSDPPYDSFNLACHVGDDSETVARNRAKLEKSVGVPIQWMEQVHGDTVRVIGRHGDVPLQCDALVTDRPGIALAAMVADCIPILLFDPVRNVIAAVHAGRNGIFLNIPAKTVRTMVKTFGCAPENIRARFGPSIGACCYEVDESLAAIARKNFPVRYVNDRSLDLPGMAKHQLLEAGLREECIEMSPTCTRCSPDHFSYRREGTTGRFAGLIWLEKS